MADEALESTSAKNPWIPSVVAILCAALAAAGGYYAARYQSQGDMERLKIQLHADELRDQRNQFNELSKTRKAVYDEFRTALKKFRDIEAVIVRDVDAQKELAHTLRDQSHNIWDVDIANHGDLSQARSKAVRTWGEAQSGLQIAMQSLEIYGSCPVRLYAQPAYFWMKNDLRYIPDDDSEQLRALYAAMRRDVTAPSQQSVELANKVANKDDLSAKCSGLSKSALNEQGDLREDLRYRAGSEEN